MSQDIFNSVEQTDENVKVEVMSRVTQPVPSPNKKGVKLIIQIPCFNEEKTLPMTINDLPTEIEGVDCIEYLIIDDGSKDRTIEVAKELGIHHIVKLGKNRGLATAFNAGVKECLRQGADIIVNTDGDNQYPGDRVGDLIQPVLKNEADICIGNRRPTEGKHYTAIKKVLHKLGTWVVRRASDTTMSDPVSGFRAISREAAIKLNIVSTFSYTTEMIIQSGHRNLKLVEIDIEANDATRKSRLFKNIKQFVTQSSLNIIRTYATYKPMRLFLYLGLIPMLIGIVPIVRFLYFYMLGQGEGMLQSLVLGTALMMLGAVIFMGGMLADLISRLRQLQEMTLETVKKIELMELEKQDKQK